MQTIIGSKPGDCRSEIEALDARITELENKLFKKNVLLGVCNEMLATKYGDDKELAEQRIFKLLMKMADEEL